MMIRDFSQFLGVLEHRARRLRGLKAAGGCLAAFGVAWLGFVSLSRWLDALIVDLSLAGLVSTMALLLAAAICWIAYRRPVHLPRLLLSLDTRLGLDERLSSLYELRRRGGSAIFRHRIESRLTWADLKWRKALPSSRWAVAASCIGVLLFAGSVVLVSCPPTRASGASSALPTVQPKGAAANEGSWSPATALPPQEASWDDAGPGTEAGFPESADLPPEYSLQDVLSDLDLREARGAVLGESPESDLERLASQQREAAEHVSDVLEQIRERLEAESGGLTTQERQALERFLQETSDPQMERALDELLRETDPEQIQRILAELTDPTSNDHTPSGEGRQTTPVASGSPDDGENPFARDEQKVDLDPTIVGDDQQTSPEATSSPGGDSQSGARPQVQQGDSDVPGAAKGSDEVGGATNWGQAAFIRETTTGSIGDSGELRDFITAGVPVEVDIGDGTVGQSALVSFDKIRSILRTRNLPNEALETVRTYFETIAEGGT